jgi:peptidoglycan/LPS O-acetylase OafA/YrhL
VGPATGNATARAGSRHHAANPGQGPRFYRPELDALRFCAFLLVFVHHSLLDSVPAGVFGSGSNAARALATILPLVGHVGNFGMSLFFILSAYLITQLLLIELDRTGGVHVKDFYTRRILRIWPLYFSFLGLSIVLGWIWPNPFHLSGGRIAAFLLLSGNWYVIRHTFDPLTMGILWSISVEEQYYLLWPGLVLLGRRRKRILLATLVVSLISLVSIALLGRAGCTNLSIWSNSLTQFFFFATGAQLALYSHSHHIRWSAALRWLAAACGIAVWFFAVARLGIMRAPDSPLPTLNLLAGYFLVALGTVLIFLAVLDARSTSIPQWLRYLGKISYGLYVFHMLMLVCAIRLLGKMAHVLGFTGGSLIAVKLTVPLLALAFTIGLAAASYRWLETPFLRLRKRFTIVASRPV